MSFFKDFVGLNYAILDPILDDFGAEGGNTIGYNLTGLYTYSDAWGSANQNITAVTKNAPSEALYFPVLNLHRNGPYGYPMWKQMRTGQTKLVLKQNKSSTFTYVQQPGTMFIDKQAKYGNIVNLTEPTVAGNLPISLIGDVSVYNDNLGIFEKKTY